MTTTLGRELIRKKLPDKYKAYADRVLDKKTTTELMTAIAEEDPEGYIQVLQDLNAIGEAAVSDYGRDAALPFSHLKLDTETKNLNKQLRALVDKVLDDDSLTEQQKEDKIKAIGYKYTQRVEDAVFRANERNGTALANQINSGSRGNKVQLMQLQFGNMMMKDALNRDIPYLMLDSYQAGTSPMAYWVSASSGRKGFYDVQAATGQAGYLGKQVTAATHDTIISENDCGTTDTGVPFPANSEKNVGAVLLRPFHNHPAGSVVTEKMVAEADDDEEMILRSPLTCRSRVGVCAHCNGLGENGKFPGIGEYVSLNAARSYVEPVTQGGISSKHKGGVGGKKVEDPEGEDQPTGFRSLERMFMVPSNFPGGAVLAETDGTVSSIRKAPQGGNYITIGQSTVYSAPERTVKVKVGDHVLAGDMLTNGVPNPAEVVALKGLGEGRKYFTNKLNDILNKEGWGTDRRNLESFTRAMVSRVKITDPDGYGDYLPGDYVDYNEIAATYKPREDAQTLPVDKATNKYLEKPVLYYSIGTRVTPAVVKELKKYKFNDVTVSDKEPPFTAQFLRPTAVLQSGANWLPRLAGERLRDGLFDAARTGITDPYDSPSYVDRIVAAPYKP